MTLWPLERAGAGSWAVADEPVQPLDPRPVSGEAMTGMLQRLSTLPRGLMTVAVAAAAATALVAVCGMVVWMILSPRRAPARG